MKLGIDYTPTGLLADYCISCPHPKTGKVGSWLFLGEGHKKGEQISPFFDSSMPFFKWANANGWTTLHAPSRPFCMIKK